MEKYLEKFQKMRPVIACLIIMLTLMIAVALQMSPATEAKRIKTTQVSSAQQETTSIQSDSSANMSIEQNKEQRAAMIATARELYGNSQYDEAIHTINAAIQEFGSDEELFSLRTAYADTYREQIKANVKTAYSAEGLTMAIQTLKNGTRVLSDDAELQELLDVLESCTPIPFENLETRYQTGKDSYSSWNWNAVEYHQSGTVSIRDANATEHSDDCILFHGTLGYLSYQYIKYTNGEFTNLSGTFLIPRTDSDDAAGILKVYADEKEVYSSGAIGRKTQPVYFDADITAAQEVTIEFISKNNCTGYVFSPVVYNRPDALLNW